MENRDLITRSAAETAALAKEIAAEVEAGGVLCLYGDLGSGKTTFTQGLAKALGIERNITSPTFIIMRTYELRNNEQKKLNKKLYHIDLYRLESEAEMEDIGLQDILEDPENIVVIEWAEKLGSLLPEKRTDIHFEYVDEDQRHISIERI